jgi:hypothetical protein
MLGWISGQSYNRAFGYCWEMYWLPYVTLILLLDDGARETWMNAPWELPQGIRHPPPAGALKIVATDTKQDGV